jgi:hypothetical protein
VDPAAQALDLTCYRPFIFPEWDPVFIINLDFCGSRSGESIIAKFVDNLVSTLYTQFSCLAQINATL